LTFSAGRTRFRRLFLIGECSTVLRADALRSAIDEAKKGSDVRNYEDAVKLYRKYFNATDSYGTADLAWMEKKQKVNKAETNRLEHELKGYKNNLIKESIRVSDDGGTVSCAFSNSHYIRWAAKTWAITTTRPATS
jgi:COP9 signalosome complex subunit 1